MKIKGKSVYNKLNFEQWNTLYKNMTIEVVLFMYTLRHVHQISPKLHTIESIYICIELSCT